VKSLIKTELKHLKLNKKLFLFLRILFTFLILGVIFYKIDFKKFLSIYKNINPFYLLPAIFFYYLAFVLLSLRWKILLIQHGKDFKLSEIFKVYLLGMVVNTISPATLGVDILRGYMISTKIQSGKSFAFASVLVDRLTGLFGIFSFVPFSVFILKGLPNPGRIIFLFILLSLSIIVLFYFSFTPAFEKIFKSAFSPLSFLKLNERLMKFYDAYKIYSAHKKEVISAYFITLLLQSFFSIQAYFCARALSLNLSPFIFVFLIPLINSLNFIPVTISGLGVREAGFYALFSFYFTPESSVSISLLYFASGVVANLPFGVYLFKSPFESEKKK